MKKFKLVIRIVLIVYILLTILITIYYEDLINHGFLIWKKGMFSFLANMMVWGLIGGILILIEFSMENLKILSLKRKLNAKEAEVIQLKAQLYDQSTKSKELDAKSESDSPASVSETSESPGKDNT